MENAIGTNGLWTSAPTTKDRTAVRQSVTRLLDTLAPQRVVKRTDDPPAAIEHHRTPDGCVLQARDAALSVSWFADNRSQNTIGELHISVWSGVVTRGGSSYRRAARATMISEQTALPQQTSPSGAVWRNDEGVEFDTASLAAHCIDLLNKQITNGKSGN